MRFISPCYGENSWSWAYATSASANEIIEYFTTAFEDMGYEIDEEAAFAFREEFFVVTTDNVVSVYWMGSDETDIDPDTPNRGYGIMVDLDEWT